jgi:hypothetical protein
MSLPSQATSQAEVKPNDKELNFRKLEMKFEQERQARIAAEEKASKAEQLISQRRSSDDEDDDSNEPYVDHRRLEKKFARFERNIEEKIDQKAEAKATAMIEAEKKSSYLRENSDFNQVMSSDVVQKFADKHPRLAENILRMPDSFERQKLVYENIKAMGIDKPAIKEPSIQEKIDANRRSPYYQPSSVGAAPYSNGGDFSPSGQKNAYEKMKELKGRLRI